MQDVRECTMSGNAECKGMHDVTECTMKGHEKCKGIQYTQRQRGGVCRGNS